VPGQRIVVIGAGVGGLTAAALLAARGESVLILEKEAAAGGKMRRIQAAGAFIDGGPTVLTMRWVFDQLFASCGTRLEDQLTLRKLDILARHAWTNDQTLDLYADLQRSADAIGRFCGAAEARRFLAFSAEAKRIYQTLEKPFLLSSRPTPVGLATGNGLSQFVNMLHINPFERMWNALGRHFKDERLRQLFGRYATYCGSSPFEAPATLMLIAHVEQEGVWTVDGGMHALARALESLATRHGATARYGAEVSSIDVSNGRVSGVRLATGERIECSDVIFNGDSNALASGLLGKAVAPQVKSLTPAERSLSAITWAAHAETRGFPLIRHNVFFSRDYRREFNELSQGYPSDPTVYVCAQDRHDDATASGSERLLILVNSPANGDRAAAGHDAVQLAMLKKLADCGLVVDLQPHNHVVTTPREWVRLFPATGGALYGRASHGWKASFLRPAGATALPGLHMAGGSVHPGPGVPMAALSGRLAAGNLLASRASTNSSRRMAIAGGISMA
jgi:1-hydroxycarotenoid 3,4-desaturase